MLLRRIIKHVKTQNWTAVALDFVIVVVGVFIGIQVSNWNDARAEQANKERYLEELSQDLELALEEIDETIAHAQMRVDAGQFLFGGGAAPAVTPAFRNMTNAFSVSNADTIEPVMLLPLIFSVARVIDEHGTAYQELVSTGNIRVLRDRQLVRDLSEYYSRYEEIQTGDQWNWDASMTMKELFQSRGIAFTQPVPPDEFAASLEGDPILAVSVTDVATLAAWQINRIGELRRQTEATLARLRDVQ